MVLGMDVAIIVPSVVVQPICPLEPPDGPPFVHENHTNHPHLHIVCVHVGLVMSLSPKVFYSFFI